MMVPQTVKVKRKVMKTVAVQRQKPLTVSPSRSPKTIRRGTQIRMKYSILCKNKTLCGGYLSFDISLTLIRLATQPFRGDKDEFQETLYAVIQLAKCSSIQQLMLLFIRYTYITATTLSVYNTQQCSIHSLSLGEEENHDTLVERKTTTLT